MGPVLVFDGLNVFMRHYVVNPTVSGHGYQAGGLVGLLKNIRLLAERVQPSRIIVVWEGGGSPRKRALYPEYKKGKKPIRLNRFYEDIPDTVENRDRQLSLAIEALKCVPVNQIYVSDCEADDVIGYICRYMFGEQRIVVVSSDRDLYQLIDDRVVQWSPGQKKLITSKHVIEKFGVHPRNMTVARSFVGDSSDNIPGIRGAGFTTMAKRFPSLSCDSDVCVGDIFTESQSALDGGTKVKLFQNIVDGEDIVERNWRLMNLDTNNLSGDQVKKIRGVIEGYEPSKNKFKLMKLFIREKLQQFDVDSFFMSVSASVKKYE